MPLYNKQIRNNYTKNCKFKCTMNAIPNFFAHNVLYLMTFKTPTYFNIIIGLCIYPISPHEQDVTQGQFLSGFQLL